MNCQVMPPMPKPDLKKWREYHQALLDAKPLMRVTATFCERTVRGTWKYFEPGDLVRVVLTNGKRLMIQPVNGKGKPTTSFPYWVDDTRPLEKVPDGDASKQKRLSSS